MADYTETCTIKMKNRKNSGVYPHDCAERAVSTICHRIEVDPSNDLNYSSCVVRFQGSHDGDCSREQNQTG